MQEINFVQSSCFLVVFFKIFVRRFFPVGFFWLPNHIECRENYFFVVVKILKIGFCLFSVFAFFTFVQNFAIGFSMFLKFLTISLIDLGHGTFSDSMFRLARSMLFWYFISYIFLLYQTEHRFSGGGRIGSPSLQLNVSPNSGRLETVPITRNCAGLCEPVCNRNFNTSGRYFPHQIFAALIQNNCFGVYFKPGKDFSGP